MAALRYVALGDSYTIGTGVQEGERWPNQLAARLARLRLVGNLAVDGFTTRDVIEVELPQLDALRPEFVSLLVGVNDVVQGVPEPNFRANVEAILEDLVRRVGPSNVVLVTIPDYTVTPAGADYGDPALRSAAIRRFNAVLEQIGRERAIAVLDIHDISLEARGDASLVAADGLHPSGSLYARWVDEIAGRVEDLLAP